MQDGLRFQHSLGRQRKGATRSSRFIAHVIAKTPADQQNCYVTGGSQGLGLAAALHLARKGASVTIVARNVEKLKAAVELLEVRDPNVLISSALAHDDHELEKSTIS